MIGFDEDSLNAIGEALKSRKQTVSIAESVTSGFLQAALSTVKDASAFFQGGITAYNAGHKCRILDVEPINALANDCVNDKVVHEMSKKVSHLFLSDYGIAVTGYSARVPERNINELYAYYAITGNHQLLLSGKITTDQKEGVDTQLHYCNYVLGKFMTLLQEK